MYIESGFLHMFLRPVHEYTLHKITRVKHHCRRRHHHHHHHHHHKCVSYRCTSDLNDKSLGILSGGFLHIARRSGLM